MVVPVIAEVRELMPSPASFSAFRLSCVPFPDCSRNSEVVSSIREAASDISENACTVPAAEDKSCEIFASDAARLSVNVLSPDCLEISATYWNASKAVLEIVSVKVLFTCCCTAVAPLSVIFGAIAFSFSLI